MFCFAVSVLVSSNNAVVNAGGWPRRRQPGLSPDAREQAAEQESAVSLDEGGEEGEDAVDGQGYEQTLPAADAISQAPPEESTDHHAQVHDQPCGEHEKKTFSHELLYKINLKQRNETPLVQQMQTFTQPTRYELISPYIHN